MPSFHPAEVNCQCNAIEAERTRGRIEGGGGRRIEGMRKWRRGGEGGVGKIDKERYERMIRVGFLVGLL